MIFPKTQLPVLQQKVFNSKNEAVNSPVGMVELKKNINSGIISNVLFDASLVKYDENYDNEQSNSKMFLSHLSDVYNILKPFITGKKIIEVGCGKGHFLNLIREKGHDVYGCDPTYEGSNKRIIKKFFSKDIELKGDVIILRHVLEHIKNPIEFLIEIAEANDNKGLVFIEVPDFTWIIENQVYFDIFYEHVNYFQPDNFLQIFKNIHKQGVFFNEQYQYVVADLSSINIPPYNVKNEITKQISINSLNTLVETLKSYEDSKIYIWGAGSKGVISAIYLEKLGVQITNMIDINPMKQGKYIALTGLKVISVDAFNKQNCNATILIANPNYTDEIKNMIVNKKCNYINL
jgi:2-polyprenyl-3-methyl-5-hydroxy-6-metoxy-1,4-benzoquinol methylase